jgi:putative membrane protein
MPTATRRSRTLAIVAAFFAATVVASCSKETSQHEAMEDSLEHAARQPAPAPAPAPGGPTAEEPQAAPDTAITDAGIAAIVVAANTVDVKNGELAQKNSASDAVKTLASQMITDHTSVNAKVNQLASRFGLAPKDNDASRRITSDGNAARAQLEGKTGAEFDRDWVANEIAYHEAVLGLLDTVLIPRATNADLVALLRAVRPTLAQHVDHARTVQRALDRPAPAAIR